MSDLKILYADPSTGRLVPRLQSPPELISGIDLLVQIVVLLYLTNGGRSIVSPGRVGGLREFIGANIDPDDPSELFADIQVMTSQIEQRIKEEQIQTNRPPAERLVAIQLIDIVPDDDQPEIEIIVFVVNEEQQTAQAVVVT